MTSFWSCHLIVDRELLDDRKSVCDFIDADCFCWGGTSTPFFK